MAAIVSVIVAIVLAISAGLAHLPLVRRFALEWGQDYLSSAQGLELEADKLDYNLFTLRSELTNVRVRVKGAEHLPPLFEADSVELDLSVLSLARGVLELESGLISGGRVQVVFAEDGRSNLPPTSEGSSEGSSEPGPAIRIRRFEASGPLLRYADRGPPLEVKIAAWRLDIEGDPRGNHRLRFNSDASGSFQFEERSIELTGLLLDLAASEHAASVREARLRAGGVELNVEGDLGDPQEPDLDLRVDLRGRAADLARMAGVDVPLGGDLRIGATVRNPPAELEADVLVRGRGLTYGSLAAADLETRLGWALARDRVEIPSLSLDAPWARLRGKGSVALTPKAGATTVELDYQRLDLEALAGALDASAKPASRASGSLRVSFPGLDFGQADANGRVRLSSGGRAAAEGVIPVDGAVSFSRQAGRLEVHLDHLLALGVDVSGSLSLDADERLGGALTIDIAELAETVAGFDRFSGGPASIAPTPVSGPLAVTVALAGGLKNPTVKLRVDGAGLAVGDLSGITLALAAEASPEAVEIETLAADWREQRLEAHGRIELEGKEPRLDLTAATADARVADLLRAMNSDTPASGLLSFEARIRGTAEAPEVELEASLRELIAYSEPFGELDLAAGFADGRFEASRLRLEKPGGGLFEGRGFFDLADDRIGFELSGDAIELRSFTLLSGQVVTGAVKLDLQASGSLAEPQVAAAVNARNLRLDERELGDFDVSATLDGALAALRASAARWNATLRADASLEDGGEATLELELDGLDVSQLEIDVGEGETLGGAVSGVVTAEGPWDAWEGFALHARFDELTLLAAGRRLGADGEVRVSYAARRLGIGRLALVSGESRLDLRGELPLDSGGPPGELRLSGGIDLSPIPVLLGLSVDEAYTDGVVQVDGTVAGSLEAPEPRLIFRLENGVVFLPQTVSAVTGVAFEIAVDPTAVELTKLEAEWAQAKISAAAKVPAAFLLGGDPPQEEAGARFQLAATDLNLGALEGLPEDLGGFVSVRVEGEASEPSLDALRAAASFERLELIYRDLTLSQQQPTELKLEAGVLRIEAFDLAGPQANLKVAGEVGLSDEGSLDLDVDANGDASVAALLSGDAVAQGPFELRAAVGGTFEAPTLDGDFTLRDGRFSWPEPRLDAADLNLDLRFNHERIRIERFDGELNGGAMEASGGLSYAGGEIGDVDLKFSASELFFDFPEGLRTLSRVDLRLDSGEDRLLTLGGRIDIEDGSMRQRLDLQSEALTFLSSPAGLELSEEPDPLLARLRYDVAVKTENPILVDNNLARMEATLDLRLAGTYYRPALLGQVRLGEGGEVYLAENDYVIETGAIDFVSETRIQPTLNLTARTQVSGHDITLRAVGDAEDLDVQFTSDTGLSQPDVISLLLTGRTLEDAQESGFNIAREQALSYLTGRLAGRASRAAERSLGLSRVRIEPNLVAAEGDPSARLTIGQNITRQLELIYSMNLTDSGDQIYITEYDVTRMFTTRGVKQSDNSYRFDFRHDLRFGLGEEKQAERGGGLAVRIGEVRITGDPRLPEAGLREWIGFKTGDRYDFFKARKRMDKLVKQYHSRGRLEARVRLRRHQRDDGVMDLEVRIEGGPRIDLVYEGADPAGHARKRVRQAWSRGVFGEQRLSDAVDALLVWLDGERRYQAAVQTEVREVSDDQRRIVFDIERGPAFDALEPVFAGAESVEPERLALILDRGGLREQLRAEPREVARMLTRYYRQEGYLEAEVDPPKLELDSATGAARAVIQIREGARFRIGELSFSGAAAVDADALRKAVTPPEQRFYTPKYLEESIEHVESLYWERGYNDVLVNFAISRVADDARVDIEFQLVEDKQDIVREIVVDGGRHVSEKFVEGRITNEVGQPLIAGKNDRSRRRLYDTGAFAMVDFRAEDLADADADAESESGLNPVRLTAHVREVSPYKLRYGAFFDTERGPGVIADFENRNILGAARVVGFRGRYDQDFREARAYFGQPLLRGRPIQSTATVFRSRELRESFIADRTGFSLQQQVKFNRRWIWTYGYRFERAHVFDRDPDPFFPFDITLNVAPLTSTLSFDSRDELLDATRGSFFSHGFEYAPKKLGSSIPLIKYFGQYFKYLSFFRPEPTPFDKRARRPRLTWASGARIGLVNGLGGVLTPPSERFFAGGGTTIRGFRQDRVGPLDFDGAPLGGEAVFVLNQEARFPVLGPFEGVGFVDVGNVYRRVEDFALSSLRKAAGLGVRIRTPFFLLRLDYGFKLDRKPDEGRGAFFFSIGQAF